ncbi:MAG: histidine kinase [Bacteroidales bacterium]|nr:histidine kinase [Bacteroidales bacterium]
MSKRTILILLLISYPLLSFTQKYINLDTYNVDSLLLILPDQLAEERVNTLNNLSVSLFFKEFDLSEHLADEAMSLAKELNYEKGIADGFRNYGHLYRHQGNYPQALNNYFEALSHYEKLDKKHTVAWVCYDIATTHYFARNYEKTIEYANMALEKFRKRLEGGTTVGSVRDTISVQRGLIETYYLMGFDESLEMDLKVLEAMKKYNFGITEIVCMTWNIAVGYYLTGETDSAKVYFHNALAYPGEDPSVQAQKYRALIWLADLHYSKGEFDTTISYLQTTFEWYNENGFLFWAMYVSNNLGSFYYENNELNIAEKYYLQSERIFKEMINRNSWYRHDSLKYIASYGTELYVPLPLKYMKEMMWINGESIYRKLYQINGKKKRIYKELEYHVAYSKARDTLNKLIRKRETIELHAKYESDRKDQQIDNLSKENEFKDLRIFQSRIILFSLAGLVLLIVILAIVLARQNKLREQQKNLLLQQKLFRLQMNPHFLFNSLSSIHDLIIYEKSAEAGKYLLKFSKLVRNIMDSSVEEYVLIEDEISTIENYLELQKVRFPDKFDYSIEIDKAIDPEIMKIPPMLVQPFIENSIEHGFKHKKAKGNLHISFVLNDEQIRLEVEDDGIGRDKAQEILLKQNKDHKSMATTITLERIQVLNKKYKKKITLEIQDLKNDNDEPIGTKVTFEIPTVFR